MCERKSTVKIYDDNRDVRVDDQQRATCVSKTLILN